MSVFAFLRRSPAPRSRFLTTKPTWPEPPTIGELMNVANIEMDKSWHLAVRRSREYADALGIRLRDIEQMETLKGVVYVATSAGVIILAPTHTCGCPYEGTWTWMIQPRTPSTNYRHNRRGPMSPLMVHPELFHFGGGTTYVALLDEKEHEEVLEAIRRGATQLAEEKIWP